MSFTKPDPNNIVYKRLWRKLNEEQRECLVKYNRIPVYTEDGRLFVIPYSRFHDQMLKMRHVNYFYQVSVQQFRKWPDGIYKLYYIHCGGLEKTEAAANVLGIKLCLETDPDLYTEECRPINTRLHGEFEVGMTLEETYEVPIDSILILGEKPPRTVSAVNKLRGQLS